MSSHHYRGLRKRYERAHYCPQWPPGEQTFLAGDPDLARGTGFSEDRSQPLAMGDWVSGLPSGKYTPR